MDQGSEEKGYRSPVGPVHPAHWNLPSRDNPGAKEEETLNKRTEDVVLRGYSVRPQEGGHRDKATRYVLVLSLKVDDSTDFKYEGPSGC